MAIPLLPCFQVLSESDSESVRLGDKPLETHDTVIFFFQLNTCGYSPYVTFSLTRGLVCRLQLLLILASAVTLRSESYGTHDHILLSQIRDSPTWRAKSPYLYPPGTGWPGYTPRHWVECTKSSLRPAHNSSARTTVENTVSSSTSIRCSGDVAQIIFLGT
jgi:hypothetical protein